MTCVCFSYRNSCRRGRRASSAGNKPEERKTVGCWRGKVSGRGLLSGEEKGAEAAQKQEEEKGAGSPRKKKAPAQAPEDAPRAAAPSALKAIKKGSGEKSEPFAGSWRLVVERTRRLAFKHFIPPMHCFRKNSCELKLQLPFKITIRDFMRPLFIFSRTRDEIALGEFLKRNCFQLHFCKVSFHYAPNFSLEITPLLSL